MSDETKPWKPVECVFELLTVDDKIIEAMGGTVYISVKKEYELSNRCAAIANLSIISIMYSDVLKRI